MWPPLQLWAAYFLDSRPLCSQLPLLDTDYPHVAVSRKADYIVASQVAGRPFDAVGPVLRTNAGYRLYRENPAVPGPFVLHPAPLRPHLHRHRLEPPLRARVHPRQAGSPSRQI